MTAALLSLLALIALLVLTSPSASYDPKRIVIIEPEQPNRPSFGPLLIILFIVLLVILAQ